MTTASSKIERWTRYHAWVMMSAVALYLLFKSPVIFLSLPLVSLLTYLLYCHQDWRQFGRWGGVANLMTLGRLLLIIGVVWWDTDLHNYIIFVAGILTLIADGLDGYYARKYNTVSAFGDAFDKEIDALFVLAYGVLISHKGLAGDWVLLPGLLRYVYVVLLSFVETKPAVPVSSFRRQFIGMWLMGTLLAPFVIFPIVYIPGLIAAIAMILYSFGIDIREMVLQEKEEVMQ